MHWDVDEHPLAAPFSCCEVPAAPNDMDSCHLGLWCIQMCCECVVQLTVRWSPFGLGLILLGRSLTFASGVIQKVGAHVLH